MITGRDRVSAAPKMQAPAFVAAGVKLSGKRTGIGLYSEKPFSGAEGAMARARISQAQERRGHMREVLLGVVYSYYFFAGRCKYIGKYSNYN